jgi:hypothetical protein
MNLFFGYGLVAIADWLWGGYICARVGLVILSHKVDTASDNWPPVGWSRTIVYIAICPMINQKGRIFCRTCRGRMTLRVT